MTTGTNTVGGVYVAVDTQVKTYQTAVPAGEVTFFGAVTRVVTPVAGFSLTNDSRTVYSPPWVDRRFTLNAGQTLTQTYTGTTTATVGGFPGVPGTSTTTTTTTTQHVRFVGLESVTVPAGTFNACKFEDTDPATPANMTTTWPAVNHGSMVKTVGTSPSGTQTIVARSILVNGAAP